ncbi:MAG: methyl-accepting chemotaxis protein [Hydrogenovibrio sp.]
MSSKRCFDFFRQHLFDHHDHSHDFYTQLQALHADIQAGQYHCRLNGNYSKAHTAIQTELNAILETFDQMSEAMTEGLKCLADGHFEYQIDKRLRGKMAREFNRTGANLQDAFSQVNQAVQRLDQGEYSPTLTISAQGAFKQLEGDLNHLIQDQREMLVEAIEGLSALSSGELTRRVSLDGYAGLDLAFVESINNALANLGSMIAEIRYGTDHFKQGSAELASASQMLAEGAEHQALEISQITRNLTAMEAGITQNAQKTEFANKLSHKTTEQVQQGRQLMTQTISAMQGISQASEQIEEIIDLIDSIAFQTNLLALNAAVEAARAGHHGRGFAVVAGEVRNLAQKSAEAAQSIQSLITATREQIQQGEKLVDATGQSFVTINDSVTEISGLISDMASLSLEQKRAIDNSLEMVVAVDSDAQSNASISEETATTSQNFSHQSVDIARSVEKFRLHPEQLHLTVTLATGNFIFARARRAHRSWVGRIRGYLNGIDVGMSQQQALDADACELGRWLNSSEAQDYHHLNEFSALQKSHSELHRLIGEVMTLSDMNDKEGAERKLQALANLSEEVIRYLDTLERTQLSRNVI